MFHKMYKLIVSITRAFFDLFDLNISRYSDSYFISKIAKECEIDLFFDIGANEGAVTQSLLRNQYVGKIVCVEPISDLNDKLCSKFSKISSVFVLKACALDKENSIKDFKFSENMVSSSLKAPNPEFLHAAPESKTKFISEVKTRRLDTVLEELESIGFKKDEKKIMLKLDVQGNENEVLAGLGDYWREISCIIAETSLVPLYEPQILLKQFIELMEAKGFEIWRIFPGHWDKKTGRMLQCDIVFVRVKNSKNS